MTQFELGESLYMHYRQRGWPRWATLRASEREWWIEFDRAARIKAQTHADAHRVSPADVAPRAEATNECH